MTSHTHSCVDCGIRVPPQDDESALISMKYGWRLTRNVAESGETTMEWRCPKCWAQYRTARAAADTGRRTDGRG